MKKFLTGSLMMMVLFGSMVMMGCPTDSSDSDSKTNNETPTPEPNPNPNPTPNPTPSTGITYTITTDGNETTDTTILTFTFSSDVTGLEYSDITLTDDGGHGMKETVSGSGKIWTLKLQKYRINIGNGYQLLPGNVKVKITKSGIETGEKTVELKGKTVKSEYLGLWKSSTKPDETITLSNNLFTESGVSYFARAWTQEAELGDVLYVDGTSTASLIYENGAYTLEIGSTQYFQ